MKFVGNLLKFILLIIISSQIFALASSKNIKEKAWKSASSPTLFNQDTLSLSDTNLKYNMISGENGKGLVLLYTGDQLYLTDLKSKNLYQYKKAE